MPTAWKVIIIIISDKTDRWELSAHAAGTVATKYTHFRSLQGAFDIHLRGTSAASSVPYGMITRDQMIRRDIHKLQLLLFFQIFLHNRRQIPLLLQAI